VANPIKAFYREVAWYVSPNMGYVEKLELMGDVFANFYLIEGGSSLSDVSSKNIERVSSLIGMAAVVDSTPATVPYWSGESYIFLLVSMIPRAVWPDKPSQTVGNDFGQRYGFLYAGDTSTSLNLPWLIEFYANFGIWGVALGMALVGIAFRFVEAKFGSSRSTMQEFILSLTLVFGLFYAETNLALMWGNLLLSYLVFYFLLRTVGDTLSRAAPAGSVRAPG